MQSLNSIPIWRDIQKNNLSRWDDLCNFLQLDKHNRNQVTNFAKFPLNLPLRLAQKIEKNNLNDPLFKQFIPMENEKELHPAFSLAPVADQTFLKEKKLLHKYEGRALLLTTSACAMHCRYCFRQNFDYEVQEKGFYKELSLIAADPSLKEVVLSGGDPLSLSNQQLRDLLKELEKINHLKIIRFHTRFPIGIPERIDEEFVEILSAVTKQVVFIIHVNHPRELDPDVFSALKKIQRLGIPLLNQSVLLKGVNDNFTTLKTLAEALISQGILPYYLHQLDRIQGAAHFEVEEEIGLALIEQLRNTLPGYAVPKYVREIPGAKAKTQITSEGLFLAQECLIPSQKCD